MVCRSIPIFWVLWDLGARSILTSYTSHTLVAIATTNMRARVDHVLPDYAPPHKTNLVFGYRTVLFGFVESLGLLNGVRRVSASELVFFLSVIRVSTVR